jgi:hypothetical protein
MSNFNGITIDDKYLFHHVFVSSRIFTRSLANVIPRTWQVSDAKENYDHAVLHRKESNRIRYSAER